MRKTIIFNGEAEIASPKIKQIKTEKVKAPKDNSRKIASLQKQIEKMQSS
jgi:hypothetical protein